MLTNRIYLPKNLTFVAQQLIAEWTCPHCQCQFTPEDIIQKNYTFLVAQEAKLEKTILSFIIKDIIHEICPPLANQSEQSLNNE